jgi:hypothetical protein
MRCISEHVKKYGENEEQRERTSLVDNIWNNANPFTSVLDMCLDMPILIFTH